MEKPVIGNRLNISKLLAYFCILSIFAEALNAQPYSAGGKTGALANISLLEDAWAARNQPGLLGAQERFTAGVWAERAFGLKELTTGAVALVIPIYKGRGGSLGASSYIGGNTAYLKQHVNTLAYGLKVAPGLYAGAGMHLLRFSSLDPYGNLTRFAGDFGMFYKSSKTGIGIRAWNPFSSPRPEEGNTSAYVLSFRREISSSLDGFLEAVQEMKRGTGLRTALHYKPSEKLALHAGFQSLPVSYTFGISLYHRNVSLNLSFGVRIAFFLLKGRCITGEKSGISFRQAGP